MFDSDKSKAYFRTGSIVINVHTIKDIEAIELVLNQIKTELKNEKKECLKWKY